VLRAFPPVTGPLPSDPTFAPHLVQQSRERWPHYRVRFQDFKNELSLFLGYRDRHRVVVHRSNIVETERSPQLCTGVSAGIALDRQTVHALDMNEEPLKKYDLSTVTGVALAKPADGATKLNWREQASVDGTKKFWFSDEDVFNIEEEIGVESPFRLAMRVMGNKWCSIGPFHSRASAQEAANRIWNFMSKGRIHHSQVAGGGHVAVASRVFFPDL
jgi:hypothetical protein